MGTVRAQGRSYFQDLVGRSATVDSTSEDPELDCVSVAGHMITLDPGPNRVDFRVCFPTRWNGRFLVEIQGGVGGSVPLATPERLREGYVVATTSRGTHPTGPDDLSTLGNAAQGLDFGGRAVHVVGRIALDALRKHYGARGKRIHRYAIGCSTGGNLARAVAETYPGDFDGVVAAAHLPTLNMWMYWGRLSQYLQRNPDAWISPEQLSRLEAFFENRIREARDGDSRDFTDVDDEMASVDFLSAPQKDAVQLLLRGWEPPTGDSTSYFGLPGYWPTGIRSWSRPLFGKSRPIGQPSPSTPGTLSRSSMDTPAKAFFGGEYDFVESFDFDSAEDVSRFQRHLSKAVPQFMFDPRKWKAFHERGGRMIWWVGTHDCVSWAPVTIAAYDRAVEMLGASQVSTVLRLYIAPGTGHCRDGTYGARESAMNTATLHAVVDWVENDVGPGNLSVGSTAGPPVPVLSFTRHTS